MNLSNDLSHFDDAGNARMVDVGHKPISDRVAIASGLVVMEEETLQRIRLGQISKGDVLQVARLAGIMAAKRTDELIPLCHSLPISSASIDFEFIDSNKLRVMATVKTSGQTGIEMEALTAVSIAALTVYDMCKAIDRAMTVSQIQLEEKLGGKTGHWKRGIENGSMKTGP